MVLPLLCLSSSIGVLFLFWLFLFFCLFGKRFINQLIRKNVDTLEALLWQPVLPLDEKYPYMLLNGIYQYPEKEIIFVVDGGGYKPGARKWLQDQIDNDWLQYKELQHKSIQLMTIAEFVAWFNREFH